MDDKELVTDNIDESYKELKQDLKDKYLDLLSDILDEIKNDVINETKDILGVDLYDKIEELNKVKKDMDRIREDFIHEEKYQSVQRQLVLLKDSLKNADEGETERIKGELKKSMGEVSTLNITLQNRLKDHRDKLNDGAIQIEKILSSKKDEIERLKKEVVDRIKRDIFTCLSSYNDELKVLNTTFGVESDERETPFDGSEVDFEMPILSFDPKKYKSESKKTFIESENKSKIKN
ncbi:MAG: hypothetical protein IJ706_09850 [Clostridia bacterium]|nr:hypothetical protein [Clostridia bacterium]